MLGLLAKTTLRQVCLKLNKYEKNKKEEFQCPSLPPTNLTSEKAGLCMVKFSDSLKCLNEAH